MNNIKNAASVLAVLICVAATSGCKTYSVAPNSRYGGKFVLDGSKIVCRSANKYGKESTCLIDVLSQQQCTVTPFATTVFVSGDKQRVALVSAKNRKGFWIFDLVGSSISRTECSWLLPREYIVAVSPDLAKVVTVIVPNFLVWRNWPAFLVAVDGTERRDLTNNKERDFLIPSVQFSEDSRLLVFSDRKDIYVHDMEESETRKVYSGSQASMWFAPSFSHDSSSIVIVSSNGLAIINPDGASNRPVLETRVKRVIQGVSHFPIILSPRFSPDGKLIAFWGELNDESGLFIIGSDGSDLRYLARSFAHSFQFSPDGRTILHQFYKHKNRTGLFSDPEGAYTPIELRLVDVASGLVTSVSVTSVRSDCFHAPRVGKGGEGRAERGHPLKAGVKKQKPHL